MPPKLPLPHKRVRVIARQLSGKNCLAAIFASRHQDASPGPLGFRRFPIFDRKRCFACSFARLFPCVLLPFYTSPGCEQPLGRGSGTVGKCTGPKCMVQNLDGANGRGGFGSQTAADPPATPAKTPEKQTAGTVTASHKMLTLQALSSSLHAGTAKRGCLGRGKALGDLRQSVPQNGRVHLHVIGEMVQTYSEPAMSIHRTKMDQMVRFGQKKSILVHLDPPTVLHPDNPYPLN